MSAEATVHPLPEASALPRWRQLRWRLAVYFVLLVVVPMAVMSVIFMQRSISETHDQALSKLESVAELKQQELDRRLTGAASGLSLLAAGDTRRDRMVRVATGQDPTGQSLGEMDRIFQQSLVEYPGFTEVFFYDTQGLVLSGSKATTIGKTVSRQPFFTASLAGPHIEVPYYELGTNTLTIMVTRPVSDADGTVVGVLAGRFNIDTLSQIMAERTGLGDTGETYLVSKQSNYLLTPSRFEGFALTHAYNSQAIERALAGQDGSGTYTSYRDVRVYGVYRWVPALQSGLIAEQAESEALQPFNQTRAVFVGLTALAALLAAGTGIFIATRLTGPLTRLTEVAERLSRGDFDARSPANLSGEVGILARTFNATAAQLQDMVASLEGRVAARTRDLFLTLEVGQLATQTYLQTELLPRVTDFIREQFALYYVQVYLLDEARRYAVLASGTGEVGQQLLARGHRLDMQQTAIVTRAALSQRPVLVADTQLSDVHHPNPLLPDTRSEVAIPLFVGTEVVGVLDMQARDAETFRADNLPVFEAMASQIASALRSAQAYAEAQAAVQRTIDVNRRLTSDSWISYLGRVGEGAAVGYEYDLQNVHPSGEELPQDVTEQPGHGRSRQVARPVVLGQQPIGALVVREDHERDWTPEELELIEDVAERVAQAVEQFRAFDETAAALSETEQQATRLAELNRMAAELGAAHDMTTVYRIVATRAQNILHGDRTSIALVLRDSESFELFGLDGERGSIALGTRLALKDTWIGQVIRSGQPGRLGDTRTQDSPELHQLAAQGLLSTMAVPLRAADEVIGTLNVASSRANAFREADLTMLSQIGSLLVSHMQNQRLLDLTQRRAAELQTVAEVGTEAAASLDPNQLLANVANLTKERFGLYHAHVYLLDEAGGALRLAAGAGEAGYQMVLAGHRIPLSRETSIVARAAHSGEAVIVNDVTQVPFFLPNPLLPHTRSEMAIPLIVGDRVTGVLDVQSDQVDRFTEADKAVMGILGSQIAVSIDNARLFADQVQTAERLREVDRLKSEFLASMSHELRTPLNSIIGYAEVLLDGIDGDLNDDMQEDVGAIYGSGKHLLNLINDILDLAKIEAGQMDLVPEPIALRPVIDDAVNTVRILVKDRPVQFVIDIEDDLPQVNADTLRLRQIINNLLTNATKFTEKGDITLAVARSTDEPGMVVISVKDNGLGIAPDKLAVIFDRFRQADQSHTRRAGGTGLGLAITRQLVEMHGGTIWVDSHPGQGSAFYFTLPIVGQPEATQA